MPTNTRCHFCLALLTEGVLIDQACYHLTCWPFVLASQGYAAGLLLRDLARETVPASSTDRPQPLLLKHPWLR